MLEKNNRKEKEHAQLQKEKAEAELAYLRTQLNPHFLFNSLNILYTQAFQLDEKLSNTILKFSDILRYSLQKSKANRSSIQEEMQLAQNYIELFKERFSGRCFVEVMQSGEHRDYMIEPLLIIPFIENAFKHGRFTDPAHPIRFSWEVKNRQFIFRSVNQIKSGSKDVGTGIGLNNVRKRLELLYPDRHELVITEKENIFEVVLRLKL